VLRGILGAQCHGLAEHGEENPIQAVFQGGTKRHYEASEGGRAIGSEKRQPRAGRSSGHEHHELDQLQALQPRPKPELPQVEQLAAADNTYFSRIVKTSNALWKCSRPCRLD